MKSEKEENGGNGAVAVLGRMARALPEEVVFEQVKEQAMQRSMG